MADIFSGLRGITGGKAPEYKTPQSVISASDIDRLIELMRTQGKKSIMSALGQSQQQGAEFMAGQGLAGTGGIPAQMWGQLQSKAFGQLGEMETGLGGMRLNSLTQLQQMANQQAGQKYGYDLSKWQMESGRSDDTMDLLGQFAMFYGM